jgi:cytochrome c553
MLNKALYPLFFVRRLSRRGMTSPKSRNGRSSLMKNLTLLNTRITAIAWVLASVAATRGEEMDFARDVLPGLRQHCIDCHGPDAAESNLRLDSVVGALRGGDSGERVIVPGKSGQSYLLNRVLSKDPEQRMPPDSPPLPKELVDRLRAWIDDARGWQAAEAELAARRVDHWSFQPIRSITPPPANDPFAANPIDAFVLRKLAKTQLRPSQQADRRTLIRRLFLVMHGLPPTREQIRRFLDDDSPRAWRSLVESVLDSPRYGERWARHWLDLIRFGETHGFETNRERPNAWPYRDYVIESLNADKPYDQFVREQIAGDAIGAPIGTGFLVAGPYDLVKGGGNLAAMQRMNELDDMINATGTTFLGLTLGCARCHNHKFDPVTQTDYYSLQAIFAGVNHGDRTLPVPADVQEKVAALDREIAELTQRLARFIPRDSDAQAESGAAKRPPVNPKLNTETFPPRQAKFVRFTIDRSSSGQPCIDELEVFSGGKNLALASAGATATSSGDFQHPLHKLAHINDGRYGNARSWIAAGQQGWVQIELADAALIDRIVWARDREGRYSDRLAVEYRIEFAVKPGQWQLLASSEDRVRGVAPAKDSAKPEYDFVNVPAGEAEQGKKWLARIDTARKEKAKLQASTTAYVGTFSQPGVTHRLYRGEPDQRREVVGPDAVAALTSLGLDHHAPEQQRRRALAEWVASKENPLTARVIVNRLWQHHFGTGLVDTPSDFGANGTRPTHPELLDWLAAELMANGWSLKHMHYLILMSHTWQQDSRPRESGMAADASSRLLWRFPPRRLEAEAIRDSMLAVTGVLDLRMGGPGFGGFKVQPENVRHYFPKESYGPDDWRRMVYMTKVRQEQESVFGAFDCPDASQVAPKRSRSTTPLQAFNLFNSTFVKQQAELFAMRIEKESPQADARRAALAFELTFGRPATAEEASDGLALATEHGWAALCRALLNANEFVFVP